MKITPIRTGTYVVLRIASNAVLHYFILSKNDRTCSPILLPETGYAGAHCIGASTSSGLDKIGIRVVDSVVHWTRRRTFSFLSPTGARQEFVPLSIVSEGDE
jgi:hypothetical protein